MNYCMDQCIKSMRHGAEFAPSIVARQWKDPMIVCHVRDASVLNQKISNAKVGQKPCA